MAFTTLVPIQTISAPIGGMEDVPPVEAASGQPGVSPGVNLPNRTRVVQFRLLSDNWVAGLGSLYWGLDASYDGGTTWRVIAPAAETPSGALSRFGEMPSILWPVERGEFSRRVIEVRVRYCVSDPLRLGVEWERT